LSERGTRGFTPRCPLDKLQEHKKMNRIILITTLIFLSLLGTTRSSQCEVVDYIVAVVNREVITLSMVEDSMRAVWVSPEFLPKSQNDAIQGLIDRKLKLQEARRLGIIVSEDELSSEMAMVASRFPSQKEFSEALKQCGITQEDLQASLIEEIMVRNMVKRSFGLFVKESDIEGEALEFFEQNKGKFIIPESVLLSQIFFKLSPDDNDKLWKSLSKGVPGTSPLETTKEDVKKKAEEVLDELKNGAEFSKYVNENEKIDYIAVDQLIPVVAATVSKMKLGEISGIVETPVGYFIIRLDDRSPSRQATFNDVKDEIKARLRQQKINEELDAWLRKQRETADIRIVNPVPMEK